MAEVLQTIAPDQITAITDVSEDTFVVVSRPGAPLQRVPYDQLLSKLIKTDLVFATVADLNASLGHEEDVVALVRSDPTPALNGWYRKIGASGTGSWQQFETLSKSAREAAEAAAVLAEGAAGITEYPSQAAGEAATSTGQRFAVVSGSVGISLIFERTAGGSVFVKTILSGEALASTGDGSGSSRIGSRLGGSAEDQLFTVINLMQFREGETVPNADTWDRAFAAFAGRTGVLLLPPMVLPLERTVSAPVGVSIIGASRGTIIEPVEGGVYQNDFLIKLNVNADGTSWATPYPNINSGVVSCFQFRNTTTRNLRCVQFGGSYVFEHLRVTGFGQIALSTSTYNDTMVFRDIMIENDLAPKGAWGVTGVHHINVSLGDALTVESVHIYNSAIPARGLFRAYGCRGGEITKGIGGVYTLEQCSGVIIQSGHWENGGVDVIDSNITADACQFYHQASMGRPPIRLLSNNGQFGDRFFVTLRNVGFVSAPDSAGFPLTLEGSIQYHDAYTLKIEDCWRAVTKWTDISKNRRVGIYVVDQNGASLAAFNGVSGAASRNCSIVNGKVTFSEPMDVGQTTVHTGITSVSLSDLATWGGPATTLFFKMQVVIDDVHGITHNAASGLGEKSIAVTAGGNVPQLNLNDGSGIGANGGYIARVFFGTASDSFSYVVDVPLIDGSVLPLTWSVVSGQPFIHLGGYPAKARTAGPMDTVNNLPARVTFIGRNVVVYKGGANASYVPTLGAWMKGDEIRFVDLQADNTGRVPGGLRRLTTGSAHVIGTDWERFYVTPPGRRTGRSISASATLTADDLNQQIDVTAASGAVVVTPPASGLTEGDAITIRKIDGTGGTVTFGSGTSLTTQWQSRVYRWSAARALWEPML